MPFGRDGADAQLATMTGGLAGGLAAALTGLLPDQPAR